MKIATPALARDIATSRLLETETNLVNLAESSNADSAHDDFESSLRVQPFQKEHQAETLVRKPHWRSQVNREVRRARNEIIISACIAIGVFAVGLFIGLLSPTSTLMFLTGSLSGHLLTCRRIASIPANLLHDHCSMGKASAGQ